jgi:hypothetical protein
MSEKLFISCRSTDSAKVDGIVSGLSTIKNEGGKPRYVLWQDKHNIPAGKDWWEAIVEAIIECDVFVFCISKAALESEICKAELAYAFECNCPILPIILEGEYFFHELKGRHEITYLDKIPVVLTDSRLQFLFYDGTSFFTKFDRAVEEFKRTKHRRQRFSRPQPTDPRSETHQDAISLYDDACDYAGRLEFEMARNLFRKLHRHNDAEFGNIAGEWIELLNQYERICLIHNAKTFFPRPDLWKTYKLLFPKKFIDGAIFDPKGFRFQYESDSSADEATELTPVFDI